MWFKLSSNVKIKITDVRVVIILMQFLNFPFHHLKLQGV